MILYHYTAREYLPAIARDGLWKGEVALTPTDCANAVWLTTDANPAGHGLSEARELTLQEKRAAGRAPDEKLFFRGKRAIRFQLVIPSTDRRLVHWPRWGRKRLAPEWYAGLNRTGGDKAKTWWLYWGTIPAEALAAVDLTAGRLLEGWPDLFRDKPAVAAATGSNVADRAVTMP